MFEIASYRIKIFLIDEADHSDNHLRKWCLSVNPFVIFFQNLAKQNNIQVRIGIATGGTVGLAEWIIDGTHVLYFLFLSLKYYNRPYPDANEEIFHHISVWNIFFVPGPTHDEKY